MPSLDQITGPADLRGLTDAELDELAEEIRERTIDAVAANAGHLAPNLGVVELTLAIHRVFDSLGPTLPIYTLPRCGRVGRVAAGEGLS